MSTEKHTPGPWKHEEISAAPELLDALIKAQMALFGIVKRNKIVQDAIDSANIAITKAGGYK